MQKVFHNVKTCCSYIRDIYLKKLTKTVLYNQAVQGVQTFAFWVVNIEKEVKVKSKACLIFFIFSPCDSPSKTMKNAFYFFLKALFVLDIF